MMSRASRRWRDGSARPRDNGSAGKPWRRRSIGIWRKRPSCSAVYVLAYYSLGCLLSRSARVRAQYFDGGEVALDCGVCNCVGTSDDGAIEVFDNPSSGERVRCFPTGLSVVCSGLFSKLLFTIRLTSSEQLQLWLYQCCTIERPPALLDRTLGACF